MAIIPIITTTTLMGMLATVNLGPLAYAVYKGAVAKWFLYYITPMFLLYNVVDPCQKKLGRTWHPFAKSFPFFHIMREHIGLNVVKSNPKVFDKWEAKEGAQCIFAIFPHGVGSDFRVLLQGMLPDFLPNIHEKVRSLAASVLFQLPLLRLITLMTGCVDAGRATATYNLKKGNSLIILPGGEQEQLLTKKGVECVYVKKRKGFVKLAMARGIPVVPTYVFGCNDLYETKEAGPIRYWLMKNMHVCLPNARGLYGTCCPYPVKNTVVVGDPVTFPTKEKGVVTQEELDEAHALFVDKLKELFDKHKGPLGYGDRELIVV